MQKVYLVLGELRNGSPTSKSGIKWSAPHEHGFVAYVICRILSRQRNDYNPKNRKDHMIWDYVTGNEKLKQDVTNFAVHKLGITIERFTHQFLMCASHTFRRKTMEKGQTHWFYLEIHKLMDIT